jgi:hypothetical protein
VVTQSTFIIYRNCQLRRNIWQIIGSLVALPLIILILDQIGISDFTSLPHHVFDILNMFVDPRAKAYGAVSAPKMT